jgi:protein TonB
MNRPVVIADQSKSDTLMSNRKKADVISIKSDNGRREEPIYASSAAIDLTHFKAKIDSRDSKLIDYLAIGVVSILLHLVAVEYFNHAPIAKEEKIELVKVPSKVKITFYKPQPKVVQPPPPPKVVAINKPPKPKIKPKPVVKPVEPPPIDVPVEHQAVDAPPAPPAPPAPAPVVEEKITQPSAGADYLNNPPPVYPDEATDRGWEGRVLMKVHVMANGRPSTVTVSKSSGKQVLDDEAVRTVKQWSFVPAMRGKTPVDGWVSVPITFSLQN